VPHVEWVLPPERTDEVLGAADSVRLLLALPRGLVDRARGY
jgi:hypothetical protein